MPLLLRFRSTWSSFPAQARREGLGDALGRVSVQPHGADGGLLLIEGPGHRQARDQERCGHDHRREDARMKRPAELSHLSAFP